MEANEEKPRRMRNINLAQTIGFFTKARDNFTQQLGAGFMHKRHKVIEGICEIMRKGTDQEKNELIRFLIHFCYRSPKRRNIIVARLEKCDTLVLEALIKEGFAVHGEGHCVSNSEVAELRKLLKFAREKADWIQGETESLSGAITDKIGK